MGLWFERIFPSTDLEDVSTLNSGTYVLGYLRTRLTVYVRGCLRVP